MKIQNMPFTVTDWENIPRNEYKGERGTSYWQVSEQGGIRVRIVEYSEGYVADHWCKRGHVFLVLEGVFGVELKDGSKYILKKGMSFQAGDDENNPHLGFSEKGAKVFIVD